MTHNLTAIVTIIRDIRMFSFISSNCKSKSILSTKAPSPPKGERSTKGPVASDQRSFRSKKYQPRN